MDERAACRKRVQPYANSHVNAAGGEKTPRYAWVVWIVTFLVSFAAPLGQFKLVNIPLYFIYVPGVSPQGGFMFDGAGFGMLMSVVSVIGIFLAFPAAFICRKLGLRWSITVATLGVIIGGILPVLAGPDAVMLCVGRFIEGLGIGLVGVAAPTLITLWFPDRTRGVMLGLWCCWVPLSITLDAAVTPVIAEAFSWQGVFCFVAAFAAVALLLFNVFYRVPQGSFADYNAQGSAMECVRLLSNRSIWLLFVVFLVFIIGQTGIVNTYFPIFLQTPAQTGGWGFDAQTASFALSVVTGISIVSNPVGGMIVNALPCHLKRFVPAAVAVSYPILFYMLFQVGNGVLLWVGVALMGVAGGIGAGGLRPLAPTIMSSSAMAATMGMAVMQFAQCLGNCFSPVFGALIDAQMGYWGACLVSIVPLSIVMLVSSLLIRIGGEKPASQGAKEQNASWEPKPNGMGASSALSEEA